MFALGYCISTSELFLKFPYNKLEMTCKDAKTINNDLHKDNAVTKIFTDSVNLVLNDIIDNNVTFEFPAVSKNRGNMHVRLVKDKGFEIIRKHGRLFKDVDFLKSNFTGNQLVINMTNSTHTRTKPIYVCKTLKDKLVKYTNEGKQYC